MIFRQKHSWTPTATGSSLAYFASRRELHGGRRRPLDLVFARSPGDFGVFGAPSAPQPEKGYSRSTYRTSIDQAFDQVIEACSEVPRQGQSGTWITRPMLKAYRELHRRGIAHSAEVWDGARLIGGVYGVEVDGAFGGESMFHREDNASKFALLSLVEHLSSRGLGVDGHPDDDAPPRGARRERRSAATSFSGNWLGLALWG